MLEEWIAAQPVPDSSELEAAEKCLEPVGEEIQQFGTPELDYAGGISADNGGNLYVTGITEGSLGDLNSGAIDGWIAKLDAESGILKDFSDNFSNLPL